MRRRRNPGLVLSIVSVVAVMGAACADATGPAADRAARVPARIMVGDGDAQSATAGSNVPVAPAILVTDDRGEGVPGVAVRFTVVEGGGTVLHAAATTDARGIASTGWTLGPAPGANTLEASADGLADVIRFTATGTSPFHIVVRWVGAATGRQRDAVDAAIERWRSVIVQDLPDIFVQAPAADCFDGQPALAEMVDDLLLFIEFANIDGAGKVLGQAGPCYVRGASDLPVLGYLQLDAEDLAVMETAGTLDDVVLHEIGHVLGFGTIWRDRGLLAGAGGSDPSFTGASALSAYVALGVAAAAVPVENTGTSGTRDAHWRESVFGAELMTGYISGIGNPMSAMTIASLQDLGYGAAAAAAAPYALGLPGASLGTGIDLGEGEILRRPTHRIGPIGPRRRIPE